MVRKTLTTYSALLRCDRLCPLVCHRREVGSKERRHLVHRRDRAFTVIEVHMRRALDEEQLLGARCLRMKLLAVPKRTGLVAGDDQQRLRQQRIDQVEGIETDRGAE